MTSKVYEYDVAGFLQQTAVFHLWGKRFVYTNVWGLNPEWLVC
jgi:hypothetical protein